jgi:site-specific DNA recombinase
MLRREAFERRGGAVECLDRPLRHAPHAQLWLQVRGAVAEDDRAVIAERLRRGRRMQQRAGVRLPWTRPP